jgi:hypothetical protein
MAVFCAIVISACGSKRISKKEAVALKPSYTPGPTVIIYKTKEDYSQLVPVMLNKERTKIIQYPSRGDVKDLELMPLKLKKGFWLDRKGVGPNTAFLSYTYQDYANLPAEPNIQELFKKIVEKQPFTLMYNCGNKYAYKDLEKELNGLIKFNLLDKKLKAIKLD